MAGRVRIGIVGRFHGNMHVVIKSLFPAVDKVSKFHVFDVDGKNKSP